MMIAKFLHVLAIRETRIIKARLRFDEANSLCYFQSLLIQYCEITYYELSRLA